jgi:hypothetical protein
LLQEPAVKSPTKETASDANAQPHLPALLPACRPLPCAGQTAAGLYAIRITTYPSLVIQFNARTAARSQDSFTQCLPTCQLCFPHAIHLLVQVKQQVRPVTQQQPAIDLTAAAATAAAARTWSSQARAILRTAQPFGATITSMQAAAVLAAAVQQVQHTECGVLCVLHLLAIDPLAALLLLYWHNLHAFPASLPSSSLAAAAAAAAAAASFRKPHLYALFLHFCDFLKKASHVHHDAVADHIHGVPAVYQRHSDERQVSRLNLLLLSVSVTNSKCHSTSVAAALSLLGPTVASESLVDTLIASGAALPTVIWCSCFVCAASSWCAFTPHLRTSNCQQPTHLFALR